MGLRARILRLVHPEGGGPRSRRVLEALSRTPRERSRAPQIVAAMIERRELVKYGDRRGARYGLPRTPARTAPRRRARRTRRFWTAKGVERLVRDYPNVATWTIARALKRPLGYVYAKAQRLGLKKSPEYLASPDAYRFRRGAHAGWAYRFPKGHVPANKGLRRPGWAAGRMKETQFKKGQRNGQAAAHYMPLGAERLVDGYRYVKVAEVPNVPYTVNWQPVHVLNWERANGRPVPVGHCLRFRDGNPLNVGVANLELITRRENALRNSLHRLPEPLKRAIYMKGALNRRINRMEQKRAENA